MSRSKSIVFLGAALLILVLALIGNAVVAARVLEFDGGPSGGVYTVFAEGLAKLLSGGESGIMIEVSPSAGSVSNLAHIDSGEIDLGIANATDIVEGRKGKLKSHPSTLKDVLAVTRLYDEYAQIAVLANSPIRTVKDLAGTRVAVGSSGSGTLTAARRFFQAIGIWKTIKPEYASFDLASDAFISGRVEAIWLMSGYPNASLQSISEKAPIRFLDLGSAAAGSRLYAEHPTYQPGILPAGTYPGLETNVSTFKSPAVWVAARSVAPDFIHRALVQLYSPEGLAFMRKVHPAAEQLDTDRGRKVEAIEFHPGARKFWEERTSANGEH